MAQQKKQDGSLYTVTKEDYYQKLNLLMIIIRDSIAVGLRKYQDVWKKYFYHQSTLTLVEI